MSSVFTVCAYGCGVFKSYEKAKEKANILANNEIKDLKSVYDDVYYNSSRNGHYITYDCDTCYDNFKVEMVFLED